MTLSEIGGSSLGGSEERRDFHPNLQLIPPTFSMSQAHPQAFMPYVQETFKNMLKKGPQSLKFVTNLEEYFLRIKHVYSFF